MTQTALHHKLSSSPVFPGPQQLLFPLLFAPVAALLESSFVTGRKYWCQCLEIPDWYLTCFISLAASSSVVMPLRSSRILMARAFRRRSLTGRLATYRVPSLRILTWM